MNRQYYVVIGAAVAAAIVAAVMVNTEPTYDDALSGTPPVESADANAPDTTEIAGDLAEVVLTDSDVMVTDGVRHIIPLNEIFSGGPPKDGIPSIDDPIFADVDYDSISDDDVVIGVDINGDVRAYPLSILVWHEIVNDVVGGVPISVTYCPLCYTNQVFERVINGQTVEFGVSGKLYNSNLLMYDRLTDSYWSQATGEAVVGELTGTKLEIVPFDVMHWKDWKSLHPDTLVLARDTGHSRPYDTDPYERYFETDRIAFPISNRDDRLALKTVILGFGIDGSYKAYPQSDVEAAGAINDHFAGVSILLISEYEGNARAFDRIIDGRALSFAYVDDILVDSETSSQWSYDGTAVSGPLSGAQLERLAFSPGFWFEWVSFHPDTELYGDL